MRPALWGSKGLRSYFDPLIPSVARPACRRQGPRLTVELGFVRSAGVSPRGHPQPGRILDGGEGPAFWLSLSRPLLCSCVVPSASSVPFRLSL